MTANRLHLVFWSAVVAATTTLSLRAAEPVLDPRLPYQAEKSNPVVYDVDYSIVVTAPYKTKVLQVWLPLPQSDGGQEVASKALTSYPAEMLPAASTTPEASSPRKRRLSGLKRLARKRPL